MLEKGAHMTGGKTSCYKSTSKTTLQAYDLV